MSCHRFTSKDGVHFLSFGIYVFVTSRNKFEDCFIYSYVCVAKSAEGENNITTIIFLGSERHRYANA